MQMGEVVLSYGPSQTYISFLCRQLLVRKLIASTWEELPLILKPTDLMLRKHTQLQQKSSSTSCEDNAENVFSPVWA